MLEVKDQGQAQVFSKKKVLKNFFQAIFKRENQKRSSQIFRVIFGVFQQTFIVQKTVLSSSRGQGNFRVLEASRPRTSKCVLEAKDVLEDPTSDV